MKPRWTIHLLLVALLAAVVGTLFLREPGFGDDLTYWSFAFDLHERGLRPAWSQASFHNLRWPVWGVCWLLQSFTGPGLLSYYGEPIIYLAAGAMLSFTFGRLLSGTPRIAWACAIAFLFHPLLDTVCHRPMPDLSEGVWGAGAVLCWWRMVHGRTRASAAGWAVLLGVLVYLTESNRLTGIFIAAVLGVCTLLYARRSFAWLVLAGGVAALCYAAEAWFYHGLFGDWLHNLHANLGGKGKKGTESISLLTLPFRFVDTLVKETRLSWVYALLALLGIGWAWRYGQPRGEANADDVTAPPRPLGRVVAVWFATLYLMYACAPQSIWPWRPVIRDADRFLAGLAVPMAVLTVCGLAWLLELLQVRNRRWGRWIYERPILTGAVVVVALALLSSRSFFSLGFVPEMRRYMRSLPAGTKVFTHTGMREFAYLVDPKGAAALSWLYRGDIINGSPKLEEMAAQSAEFWYARKLVWLNTRKQLEQKSIPQQRTLPSYFDAPEKDWALARLLAKGDTPDLVFYRRRTPEMAKPLVLEATAPEWGGKIPPLPYEWTAKTGPRSAQAFWKVPPQLRGKSVRVELEASADQVQALLITMRFAEVGEPATGFNGAVKKALIKMRILPDGEHLTEYVLKPYLHPEGGKEFFVLSLPARGDQCAIQFKYSKSAQRVRVTGFHASFEDELAGAKKE